MSGYIITYSKKRFYPLEPIKEDIHIEDIAHSLSLMIRANGLSAQSFAICGKIKEIDEFLNNNQHYKNRQAFRKPSRIVLCHAKFR